MILSRRSLIVSHVVTPPNALDVAAYFKTKSRIEATCRFIKEEYLGVGDQPTCDTQPLLLSSAQALLDRGPNNRVCLRLKAKAVDQIVNALESLFLGHSTLTC